MCKIETARALLTEAYQFAKQSHDRCYDDDGTDQPTDLRAALALAAMCTSRCAEAASIYLMNSEIEDESIPKLLRQFFCVVNEVRKLYEAPKRNATNLYVEFEYLGDLLNDYGYTI